MENRVQNAFRIAELIRLDAEQKLSEQEAMEFTAWLQAAEDNRNLVQEWKDEAIVQQLIDNYLSATDVETAFEAKIASRLYKDELKIAWYRTYWMTGIAATVFAAMLGTTLWYLMNRPKPAVQVTAGIPNTIPGKSTAFSGSGLRVLGKDRALLTTAEGHTIALGEAPLGLVTLQGATRIVKTAQGVLQYQPLSSGSDASAKEWNTVSTPRGGTYRVVLPDGTIAWLNAASRLRFPVAFTGGERKVSLEGEAYFEVKDQPSAPFKVQIDHSHTEIQVLGTHFNVLAYEDDPICKTTVLEGSVKVTAGAGASGTLQKEQEALSTSAGPVRVVNNPHAADAIAWTNDRLILNRNVDDIMRDISRWYDVKVVYNGDVTRDSIGGVVPRDSSLSYVLNVLQQTSTIHFTLDKRRIIVTP
jgi:ferric-dicitrate binding protein FerR (iron transport regulator)